MVEVLLSLVGFLLGVGSAAGTWFFLFGPGRRRNRRNELPTDLAAHFAPAGVEAIVVSERTFPYRMRADLQRAVDGLFDERTVVERFCGLRQQYGHEGLQLAQCLSPSDHNPVVVAPPEYEDVDVGEDRPLRVLKAGIWFLRRGENRFAVLVAADYQYGRTLGVAVQIATVGGVAGSSIADELFKQLEEAVSRAPSYRGKILSLESDERAYSGEACGIRVHQLRAVEREQVILPPATLELLDRNVVDFVRRRSDLKAHGQATKKGLLFYGPPGTGKTHTIHYLTRALDGHTTLLVTADQIGLLDQYMTLARLLQPTIMVMEDVDLVARNRSDLNTCEEVVLNKLLNEMDGLREQADILFILTTNRPETLEAALASRPGRVDQAIEFPLPDEKGRAKLVRLYSAGIAVPPDAAALMVNRTQGVSAAFIKELVRRSVQFHLERNGTQTLSPADVEAALDEMLFSGGSLNLKILGADRAATRPAAN